MVTEDELHQTLFSSLSLCFPMYSFPSAYWFNITWLKVSFFAATPPEQAIPSSKSVRAGRNATLSTISWMRDSSGVYLSGP